MRWYHFNDSTIFNCWKMFIDWLPGEKRCLHMKNVAKAITILPSIKCSLCRSIFCVEDNTLLCILTWNKKLHAPICENSAKNWGDLEQSQNKDDVHSIWAICSVTFKILILTRLSEYHTDIMLVMYYCSWNSFYFYILILLIFTLCIVSQFGYFPLWKNGIYKWNSNLSLHERERCIE